MGVSDPPQDLVIKLLVAARDLKPDYSPAKASSYGVSRRQYFKHYGVGSITGGSSHVLDQRGSPSILGWWAATRRCAGISYPAHLYAVSNGGR